jgi:hypothetical protein
MTIKFHAIFAVGSLLFLLSMQPAAKADTIHAIAGVNSSARALIQDPPPLSFVPLDAPLQSVVSFRSDRAQYSIGEDAELRGERTLISGPNTFSHLTSDATSVPTPEPSSLLLLLLGTGGLLAGLAVFKNKSRTGGIV